MSSFLVTTYSKRRVKPVTDYKKQFQKQAIVKKHRRFGKKWVNESWYKNEPLRKHNRRRNCMSGLWRMSPRRSEDLAFWRLFQRGYVSLQLGRKHIIKNQIKFQVKIFLIKNFKLIIKNQILFQNQAICSWLVKSMSNIRCFGAIYHYRLSFM